MSTVAPLRDRTARAGGGSGVVVSATAVLSGLNYLYTVTLIWLLPPKQYAVVGSISALLLIWGTVAGASVPWVLAREVVSSEQGSDRRSRALCFAAVATNVQAVGAGVVTCLVAVHYAAPLELAVAFGAVIVIFGAASGAGYLQGLLRFRLLAVLRICEVLVKLGTGIALVLLGEGASGAIAGFVVGAAVVAGVALVIMRPDVRWVRSAVFDRRLWTDAAGLASIQGGVAVLASLDIVIGSLVLGASAHLATYQAANVVGRVPLFVGAAVSVVVFPLLTRSAVNPVEQTRESLWLFFRVSVPVTAVTMTLPHVVVTHLFPTSYGDVSTILPWSALAGLALGVANLTTTYFQAAGLIRRTTLTLAVGLLAGAVLDIVGLHLYGGRGLAVAVAVQATAISVSLVIDIQRRWPGSLRSLSRTVVGACALAVPLWAVRSHVVVWAAVAVLCAGLPALAALVQVEGRARSAKHARPRVLHFSLQDPRPRPEGGGSSGTYEINTRLAKEFDITVVSARFPGCRSARQEGVRYFHIGLTAGRAVSPIAYFLCIPLALLRYPSDLVVEDFSPPFAAAAIPWMTRRPVVGVAQWLSGYPGRAANAQPAHLFERLRLRSYRQVIAVSDGLAGGLRERNQRARVAVLPSGIERARWDTELAGRLGDVGPAVAAGLDWDALSRVVGGLYRLALAGEPLA